MPSTVMPARRGRLASEALDARPWRAWRAYRRSPAGITGGRWTDRRPAAPPRPAPEVPPSPARPTRRRPGGEFVRHDARRQQHDPGHRRRPQDGGRCADEDDIQDDRGSREHRATPAREPAPTPATRLRRWRCSGPRRGSPPRPHRAQQSFQPSPTPRRWRCSDRPETRPPSASIGRAARRRPGGRVKSAAARPADAGRSRSRAAVRPDPRADREVIQARAGGGRDLRLRDGRRECRGTRREVARPPPHPVRCVARKNATAARDHGAARRRR